NFFFQAEDGIRDFHVTGVQTCALPIFRVAKLLPGPERTGAESAMMTATGAAQLWAASSCASAASPRKMASSAGSSKSRQRMRECFKDSLWVTGEEKFIVVLCRGPRPEPYPRRLQADAPNLVGPAPARE